MMHNDSLLQPGDPTPFECRNAAGKSPLILFCDHAGRAVPRSLNNLGLGPEHFDKHIAWDIGIAELGLGLSERLEAPLLLNHYSRLVIDCNRHLKDPTSIPQISDRIDIPGNRALTPEQRRQRAAAIFDPYHAALSQMIDARLASGQYPVLLSLHSFTPVMNDFQRPWHIGILWNRDDRLPLPLMRRFAAEEGLVVGDNEPYSGRDGHGFSMQYHAEARGLAHALIEVRQDLIGDSAGVARWAEILHRVCHDVLADATLYHPPAVSR
ncbi:MAG TPA: N-formylglutamate amidohydrolase [Dongiaceae bacterium]|nr:N-formylglutamate amidohydrolase [Dongiaceae bacterium]